jgi:type VI secretion system secreted protein VgrG
LTAPNGTDTTAYSFQLTATGTATISYSVSSGALPTGVTLDPTTGLISGNPTTPGTYTFQITADNGHAPADTHNYTVATARSVRLSTPAGPPLLPPPAAAARFSGSCSRASVLPHSSAAWFADFALDDNEGYRQADER